MYYDFGDGKGLVAARLHANGGGIVALTAQVDATAFVDRGCVIFGYACVKGRVRILGHCRISGVRLPGNVSTLIEDEVLVSGNVVIEGHVLLRDNAQVRDHARISGSAAIMHNATVLDRAKIVGEVQLRDYAYAHESVTIAGDAQNPETLILSGRECVGGDKVLRSMQEINAYLRKPTKRRRTRRAASEKPTREPVQITVSRAATVMPCLEDLENIKLNQAEERLAII